MFLGPCPIYFLWYFFEEIINFVPLSRNLSCTQKHESGNSLPSKLHNTFKFCISWTQWKGTPVIKWSILAPSHSLIGFQKPSRNFSFKSQINKGPSASSLKNHQGNTSRKWTSWIEIIIFVLGKIFDWLSWWSTALENRISMNRFWIWPQFPMIIHIDNHKYQWWECNRQSPRLGESELISWDFSCVYLSQ